jgi:hypothetical protein
VAGPAAMNDTAPATGPFAKAAALLVDLAGIRLTVKRPPRARTAGPAHARSSSPSSSPRTSWTRTVRQNSRNYPGMLGKSTHCTQRDHVNPRITAAPG